MKFLKRAYCRTFQGIMRCLMPMMPYREPKLFENYDKFAAAFLDAGARKVLIVTDKTINSLGLTGKLQQNLQKYDIKFAIYDQVLPNPTINQVENGLKAYLENNCDSIVAVGGGSVIDTAKLVGARVVKPNLPVFGMQGLLKINKKLPPIAAIPTTAGTGSETTVTAVVTDDKKHKKYPINDFCLIPHFAVLDSELTLGLGKFTTATTGMDALTHAVEAYIGKSTTKKTRQASLDAIKLIKENLAMAYDDGKDVVARKNMLWASYLAGVAFTRSYVGYVHAIAHSLGGQYNTPHGYANAVILPLMLEVYGASAHKKLAEIAKYVGCANKEDPDDIAAHKFIEWVKVLNKHFEIPETFEELKEKDIEKLAKQADKEANPLYPVPLLLDRAELEHVYHKLLAK